MFFSDYLRSYLILLRELSFVLTNYASQLKNLFKVTEVTTEFILRLSKTQERSPVSLTSIKGVKNMSF